MLNHHSNDDFYFLVKRNKSNSQEELNNAVQAFDGYMTRNKLKQLSGKLTNYNNNIFSGIKNISTLCIYFNISIYIYFVL